MYRNYPLYVTILLIAALVLAAACGRETGGTGEAAHARCDADNGGLVLPKGFCAAIVADNLSFVRHIAVGGSGEIYATLRNRRLALGGLLVLSDGDGDGRMEQVDYINHEPGMGIAIRDNYLYFATDTEILRYRLNHSTPVTGQTPEVVVSGFPEQARHAGKPLTIDDNGNLYVNVGAPSNACQLEEGRPGSPGMQPCAQLEEGFAGIWRFRGDRTGSKFVTDGYRFASGIRNAYAMDWHQGLKQLYVVQHGRDDLAGLWPEIFSEEDGANLPAEELLLVEENSVHSWPYCYFDPMRRQRLLAPEYGGNGVEVGRCSGYPAPIIAFPAHYGPNDMIIYHGDQFPAAYRDGAFIAFHGSYNRGPFEQVGYQLVFVPLGEGRLSDEWWIFADGFAGRERVDSPADADHRPTGLAVGPDGSLYVSDSVQGRIWRITALAARQQN